MNRQNVVDAGWLLMANQEVGGFHPEGDTRLLCPVCDGEENRVTSVRVQASEWGARTVDVDEECNVAVSEQQRAAHWRGHIVTLEFSGETCPHRFALEIAFHKGTTMATVIRRDNWDEEGAG